MNGTHIATTNSIWLDDKRDIYSIYSYRQEQKKEFYGRNYIKYPNRKKNGTEKLNMCAMYGIYYTFWCTSEHDIQERTWKWKYAFRWEIFQKILVFFCLSVIIIIIAILIRV